VSSITTDHGVLHYEVYGRGRPVIFLHGWLGSVNLWRDSMTYFGKYYRTYSIDFWGFGESGKKLDTYRVKDFVGMVDQFMEQLGIVHSPLVGHSMGGTVSLSMAIQHPDKVKSVTVIGSPIVGSSLALMLKLAGYRFNASVLFRFFGVFKWFMRNVYSKMICKDPRFPAMMESDLNKLFLESFLTSISTLRRTDLRPDLHKVNIPVMGMYGKRDLIVNPNEWKSLYPNVPHAKIEIFDDAGHFIMLDSPEKFNHTLKQFIDEQYNVPTL